VVSVCDICSSFPRLSVGRRPQWLVQLDDVCRKLRDVTRGAIPHCGVGAGVDWWLML